MQYDSPEPQTRENRLELAMVSWIYQSHLWRKVGTAENNIIACEWCGKSLTTSAGLTVNDDLCLGNPKIRDMRRNWIERMREGMTKANETIKESREGICQDN